MGKVTYLFGAGASCLCLPLVEEVPQSLSDFYTLITDKDNIPAESKYYDTYYKMLQDLEVLIHNAKIHSSIDTYAKKLFLIHQGSKSLVLIQLKILLSFCFVYEQIRYPPDPRYDTFFASTLKDSPISFNDNIRIVSWNYDYQFEKAHFLYTGQISLIETQKTLSVISNDTYKGGDVEKFSIFKINGTTSFDDRDPGHLSNLFNDLSFGIPYHKDKPKDARRKPGDLEKVHTQKLVRDFLEIYQRAFLNEPTILPLLNFAWESKKNGNKNPVLNAALNSIKDSDALVIIGYSFPFFNRNIDQRIIGSLRKKCKVYIQDLKFDDVATNLESISKTRHAPFIQVKSLNQFYLPGELKIDY